MYPSNPPYAESDIFNIVFNTSENEIPFTVILNNVHDDQGDHDHISQDYYCYSWDEIVAACDELEGHDWESNEYFMFTDGSTMIPTPQRKFVIQYNRVSV